MWVRVRDWVAAEGSPITVCELEEEKVEKIILSSMSRAAVKSLGVPAEVVGGLRLRRAGGGTWVQPAADRACVVVGYESGS